MATGGSLKGDLFGAWDSLARVRIPRQTKKYSASTQGSVKLWFPLNATFCQTCLYHTIGNPAYGNTHASSQATRSVNKHVEG